MIPTIKPLSERPQATSKRLPAQGPNSSTESEQAGEWVVTLEGASQLAREALGGKAIEISAFPFNIGRWEDRGEARLPFNNDLAIGDQRPYHVSRVHFCIARTGDAFSVVDRGSRLGTIVNGKRISGKAENKAAPLDREVNEILVGSRHSPYAFSVCIHPSGPTDG